MYIKFKEYWYNASIRKKLMIFLLTVICCISVFSVYMLFITYSYTNKFSSNVTEYFKINVLQQNNTKNDRLINKYFDDFQLESLSEYNQSVDNFYQTLREIEANSHSIEAYLLIRSIKNSFESYCQENSLAIRKQRDGLKDFTIHYYSANRINQYLNNYIAQLLEVSLWEGNTAYRGMVTDARINMLLSCLAILAYLLFCLIFGVAFSNYLTRPIEHLAKLSAQMAEGNLNIKEVKIASYDEVGILAKSFNRMSSSIRNLVYDLEKKALIEKKLHSEELKNTKNRELLKEARFLALQSQINPHFLFNTLNTVSRVITLNRSEEAIKLIAALADILRYNMGDSKLYATLEDELAITQQYVHIQQFRFGDRLKADFDCLDLEPGTVLIPRFTLQPIVENSIIHGIEPKVAGGRLKIKARIDKDSVIIKIIDNGVGISKEQRKTILFARNKEKKGQTESIGLFNVMNRLTIFCGKRGCFDIKSKLGLGTIVILRLPIKGKEHVYTASG